MEIRAALVGQARIREAARWMGRPSAVEVRRERSPRLLRREDTLLKLYDLNRFFRAEASLINTFTVPWPDEHAWEAAVSPDGDVGVFCKDDAVCAVTSSGVVLWEHRGHGRDHPKENRSSCRVTDDGRYVWAMLVGEVGGGSYLGDEWLVLEADSGRVVSRETLDCAAVGGEHLSHPDGQHMGLGVGEGQDGAHMYWGRLEDGVLRVWTHDDDDRILTDVHPNGLSFITFTLPDEIAWHSFPGGALIRSLTAMDAWGPASGDDEPYWDVGGGYIDADTVLATATAYAKTPQDARHILIDSPTGTTRGEVRYPLPVTGYARPLADGTWLTAENDTVFRWRVSRARDS
ncbi:hypothetical protein [Streptosporangium sp. NBC_01469]|uniref:hypothetical protein n=1 Tax=Streptosporangium sp. NBC_01469 TaxID=2903898 RepID=UPI002E2961C1|nr:hypothetical protein [Streptosporangium sp. NBC_01469]